MVLSPRIKFSAVTLARICNRHSVEFYRLSRQALGEMLGWVSHILCCTFPIFHRPCQPALETILLGLGLIQYHNAPNFVLFPESGFSTHMTLFTPIYLEGGQVMYTLFPSVSSGTLSMISGLWRNRTVYICMKQTRTSSVSKGSIISTWFSTCSCLCYLAENQVKPQCVGAELNHTNIHTQHSFHKRFTWKTLFSALSNHLT